MPFLPPNQQRQSTEGTSTEGNVMKTLQYHSEWYHMQCMVMTNVILLMHIPLEMISFLHLSTYLFSASVTFSFPSQADWPAIATNLFKTVATVCTVQSTQFTTTISYVLCVLLFTFH